MEESGTVPANFLHIRKCGGSAIRAALGPYIDALAIKLHAHNVRLADIDAREPVFFSVRHPVARFISGFNSRLRKGAPLYDRPWNAEEAEAFARFETPEQLALALGDANTRDSAEQALCGISHVRHTLSQSISLDEIARYNVIWIGFQDTLDDDFERLKHVLGLPSIARLPEDPVVAHRTPDGYSRELSDTARHNLEDWYAEDIALYQALRTNNRS
jgi:hypothetical protein